MKFVNQGVLTGKFTSSNTVTVILKVNALNGNEKNGTDADAFTFYGLNESGEVVVTVTLDEIAAGENTVTLSGNGIVQVKVIMTDYPHNGTKFCNVSLGGITIITGEGSGNTPSTSETPVTSETPSEEPSSEAPVTSETPVTSEDPVTSEEVSSEVTSNPSTSEDVEIVVNNIADLIEVIGTEIDKFTSEQYTITATITSWEYSEQYNNYTLIITDETGSIEFYRGVTELDDNIVLGDTITVKGYAVYFANYGNPKYEFSTYNNVKPQIIAVEHNETTIDTTIENGTITNVDGSAFTTDVMTGDTVSFKVEPASGYKITSVKHNDISLTDNGGIYTFDAVTTNEIVVTTVSESAPTPTKIDGIGADFTAKTATNSNYTNTWDYGTWSITGGANNNGSWAFLKFGGKSSNLTTCPVPSASTKEAVSQSVCQVVLNMNSGTVPSDTMTASLKLIVASDANFTNIVDTVDVGSVTAKTAKEYIFQPTSGTSWDANLYYKIEFVVTNTSGTNGIVWVDSIEFYTLDN